MIEINPSSVSDIKTGNFPLNHDCILKVEYLQGSPLRNAYLTCRAQDSGALVLLFSSLSIVKKVNVSSVEEVNL